MDIIRLRQIVDEIRHLPDAFGDYLPSIRETGGLLVEEALGVGGFSGAEYAAFRVKVADAKREYASFQAEAARSTPPVFPYSLGSWIFNVAARHFASALFVEFSTINAIAGVCNLIADAIEKSINNMPVTFANQARPNELSILATPSKKDEAYSEGTGEKDSENNPPLGERSRLVLTVLRNGKAFDSDHRITTADIAVKAVGSNADANQFKEVIADLKQLKYLDTRVGRGGGCWLTSLGQERAAKL